MATRSVVGLRAFADALVGGSKSISPADMVNLDPPEHEIEISLANGANTINVPTKARGVVIIPDSTSSVTKTLKGISGDTGVLIRKDAWSVISFDSPPPASFVITTSGADTGKYTRFIFF